MATYQVGRVTFLSKTELPKRWAKILPYVTHKLWERACRAFGDVPARSQVTVFLHDKPVTALARLGDLPPYVLIGLKDVTFMAVNKINEGSSQERFLRAFRVIAAEELVHLRDLLEAGSIESTYGEDGRPVEHYSQHDCEYRALKFAVEATGQRSDLLARVEKARNRESMRT